MSNGKICFMQNENADLYDDGQIKKSYNKFVYGGIETIDFTPLSTVQEFELEEPPVYDEDDDHEIEEEDE